MSEDQISNQSSIRRSTDRRKSKESKNSLSTITEEPKSGPTASSKTGSKASIQELPSEYENVETKRLRKYSKVLKKTSQEIILPRDTVRTEALRERLLSQINISGKPLFPTVVSERFEPAPLVLLKATGLSSIDSLQEALQIEHHKQIQEIYRSYDKPDITTASSSESSASCMCEPMSSETQTDLESETSNKLRYIMGLPGADEEENDIESYVQGSKGDEADTVSESMRQAQKYLRVHRIFEFFQFIIAHLLSALPDNPIQFIIDLLDQCLIYRAGLSEPPLLYNRKHLECLFYLMDKMRTGYIDMKQYKTGMRTVGICSFDENPRMGPDETIEKSVFIEEAYDCLCHLLNDMIRRRRLPQLFATPIPMYLTGVCGEMDEEYTSEAQKIVNYLEEH